MDYIIEGIKGAFEIIFSLDKEFLRIVYVSLKVSLISTSLATMLALPFGIWVGIGKFRGKEFVTTSLHTFMSFPTVVVGLFLYSLLSRRGPLGGCGLLFTQTAMIMGQCILAFPLIAAFVASGARNLGIAPFVAARQLGAGKIAGGLLFMREAKFIVATSILAGFGRVFAEVGVSMMLGGNIRFYTRNITTAIALETSKGNFSLGLALGMVLMIIAFFMNAATYRFQTRKL
jgi:tungstate transport system permease protein